MAAIGFGLFVCGAALVVWYRFSHPLNIPSRLADIADNRRRRLDAIEAIKTRSSRPRSDPFTTELAEQYADALPINRLAISLWAGGAILQAISPAEGSALRIVWLAFLAGFIIVLVKQWHFGRQVDRYLDIKPTESGSSQ